MHSTTMPSPRSLKSGRARMMIVGLAATVIATSLAGCHTANGQSSSAAGTSPTAAAQTSALSNWNKAYSFLSAQTTPTEIACGWFVNDGGRPSPAPKPTQFYDFSEGSRWKAHLITRKDPLPKRTFEMCQATVPTSIPYGPAIETFLRRYGLAFVADPSANPRLTPIEIAYAGQNASDPDIIYRDEPGLFGLEMALAPLGTAVFVTGTSKIVQPTTDAMAARYLRYATPLLNWYGYTG